MKHPYEEYEKTELWEKLEREINNLVDNGDIELKTQPEYIIGYLCKTIKTKETSSKVTKE